MPTFEDLFYNTPHRICQKWTQYFPVYERFFARFKARDRLTFLEIGISQGGSLDLWRAYFGPHARIVGVDVDPRCRDYETGNTQVRIGSQADPAFLSALKQEFGPFDLVLDDGGHTMEQQTVSFTELYPAVALGGVYMVEDVHTSYHENFGGGLRNPASFIEFAKAKVDELNAFHTHANPELFTELTRTTTGISFYDSIVVFEKNAVEPPRMVQSGTGS